MKTIKTHFFSLSTHHTHTHTHTHKHIHSHTHKNTKMHLHCNTHTHTHTLTITHTHTHSLTITHTHLTHTHTHTHTHTNTKTQQECTVHKGIIRYIHISRAPWPPDLFAKYNPGLILPIPRPSTKYANVFVEALHLLSASHHASGKAACARLLFPLPIPWWLTGISGSPLLAGNGSAFTVSS